jgi:hypothetical protein
MAYKKPINGQAVKKYLAVSFIDLVFLGKQMLTLLVTSGLVESDAIPSCIKSANFKMSPSIVLEKTTSSNNQSWAIRKSQIR